MMNHQVFWIFSNIWNFSYGFSNNHVIFEKGIFYHSFQKMRYRTTWIKKCWTSKILKKTENIIERNNSLQEKGSIYVILFYCTWNPGIGAYFPLPDIKCNIKTRYSNKIHAPRCVYQLQVKFSFQWFKDIVF